MSGLLIEFVSFVGGTLFSLITAFATVLIVKELRDIRLQKKLVYTAEYLSKLNTFPFPYHDFRKETLERLTPRDTALLAPEDNEKRHMILKHLNSLEIMSVQINKGILDEELCRNYARSMFIEAFGLLRIYILNLRDSRMDARLFEEFEQVVRRWEQPNDN